MRIECFCVRRPAQTNREISRVPCVPPGASCPIATATGVPSTQLWARMLSLLVPAALALNNGLGRTPARGWNAWNSIRCEGLNENLIREVADAMVR